MLSEFKTNIKRIWILGTLCAVVIKLSLIFLEKGFNKSQPNTKRTLQEDKTVTSFFHQAENHWLEKSKSGALRIWSWFFFMISCFSFKSFTAINLHRTCIQIMIQISVIFLLFPEKIKLTFMSIKLIFPSQ